MPNYYHAEEKDTKTSISVVFPGEYIKTSLIYVRSKIA